MKFFFEIKNNKNDYADELITILSNKIFINHNNNNLNNQESMLIDIISKLLSENGIIFNQFLLYNIYNMKIKSWIEFLA